MRNRPKDPGLCYYVAVLSVIVGTVAAIICLIVGVCLLIQSMGSERGLKLAACSDAIIDWNDVGREQFNTLQDVSVSVDNKVHPLQLVLGNSADVDPMKEELSRKELATYIATKYMVSGRDAIRQISWNDTKNVFISLEYLLHPRGKATQKITIPPVSLIQVRVHKLTNAKACRFMIKGSWVQNRCESYHRATTVCAAVQQNAQRQWVLESGCGGTSFGTPAATSGYAMDYVRYEQVPGKELRLGAGLPPEGVVNTAGIKIELRSAADPYIKLERITKGKLAFGATTGKLNLVGGSLVVLGLCLMLPCCVWLVSWRATKMKTSGEGRYYADDLMDEDFDGDL